MFFKMITLLNIDCLEYMLTLPDSFFDLAIVDPPYGINVGTSVGRGNLIVGGGKLSTPKFIGDLMIQKSPKEIILLNCFGSVKIK